MARQISAKARLSIGQAGLVVSLVLTAALIGLVPDRQSAVREGRAAMAEMLAANASILGTIARVEDARAALALAVERNPDLYSAALRRADGALAVAIGEHQRQWLAIPGQFSTASQVRVPIMQGRDSWGQLELRFRALHADGWLSYLDNDWLILVAYVGLLSFVAFYFYLGRMLKQLDPSQAVPGRVRSALDTMAEGLLVLDGAGNIVLANTAFASLLDQEPEALVGKTAASLNWLGDDSEELLIGDEPWFHAMETGERERNRLLRLETGQGLRTFMVNCSPVLGEGNRGGGVLVSLDDITELEEKEVQLRKSKREADEANQAKSEFLANMSHEIRTPMNAILGFTEVLKRGYSNDPRESLRYLDTIHSSGKHLLDLINDILDLSKVESGKLEMEDARFAAHLTIQETLKTLQVRAEEKGITLTLEAPDEFPETIVSDPGRLRQIITNLVGNAIKFTEHGGVTVRPSIVTVGDRALLRVDIDDTGVGMKPDQLARIFDPFTQADSSVTRKFGGTGLGLAISQKFARALGGDIVVASTLGEGSTFTVTVDAGSLAGARWLGPDELLITQSSAAVPAVDAVWQFPRSRVLVVDDGVENRELVRLVLHEVGLTVVEAENGAIGVEHALEEQFDIILMDVNMPVMDGYAATKAMREANIEVPIVALTADAMKGVEERLMAAGFTAYMTKPIDIETLLRELASYLGGFQLISAQEDETPPSPMGCVGELTPAAAVLPSTSAEHASPVAAKVTATELAPSDAKTADRMPIPSALASRNARFTPVVERFLAELQLKLGEMDDATARGDLAAVADLAHWLKGAGGTVGYDVLNEPAAALETHAHADNGPAVAAAITTLVNLSRRLVVTHDPSTDAGDSQTVPQPLAAHGEAPVQRKVVSRLAHMSRARPVLERFVAELELRMPVFQSSWKAGDMEILAHEAHWLRGAGGSLGFDHFTEPAGALEEAAQTGDLEVIPALLETLQAIAQGAASSLESTGEDPAPSVRVAS